MVKHGGKDLRNYNKKIRGDGVSLMNSPGRRELGGRVAINNQRERARVKTSLNPGNPWGAVGVIFYGMDNLLDSNNIIEQTTTRNKTRLFSTNQRRENKL